MNDKQGLTSAQLKYIAIALMLLDHAGGFFRQDISAFIRELCGVQWPWDYYIFAAVFLFGRIAFPLFAFQLAQGIRYTRSPATYMGRLFLFGLMSEIPYHWLHQRVADKPLALEFGFSNVMFTMLLAVAACYLYQKLCERGISSAGAAVPAVVLALLAEELNTDYGAAGVTLVFAFYLIQKTKSQAWIVLIWALYTYVAGSWSEGNFYGQYGWYYISVAVLCTVYALLAIPLLAFYNGQKGTGSKYLFYWFYPVHLWGLAGLYLITRLI